MLTTSFLRHRKIDVAWYCILHLDEVHSPVFGRFHGLPSRSDIFH